MCSHTVFYDCTVFREKKRGNLQFCVLDQCCIVFKSLSLAIIYSILGKFAEHACSYADLKLSVLPKDISAADGKEKVRHICSRRIFLTGLKEF